MDILYINKVEEAQNDKNDFSKRNFKSTTECFDVKSEDISKNEIKFICETDSIVEFVKELCSNESIF